MLDLFANPGFLAVAAGLVSVPIIIHLINRMRFKRLQWAAMEFLLKAQKRSRRRLIIEQLLLLALRCLLVAMVGLLVMRFVGCSFEGLGKRQALHIVLLDDTLSMNDQWSENGKTKDSFEFAKQAIVLDKIAKEMGRGSSTDKLIILPLTQIADDASEPKVYERLNDGGRMTELENDLKTLKASIQHVDVQKGVKRVANIVANNPESMVTLHVLGDFRQKDWEPSNAEALYKSLLGLAEQKVDIRMIDSAHPYRVTDQGGIQESHDNVAIADLRPNTRIAGKNMPVNFTINVVNNSSREANLHVTVFDDATGAEKLEVDFNPPLPLKVPANGNTQATFDIRFSPQLRTGEPHFARISARLENAQRGELENDSLPQDNVRYAAVEIRDRVPILIIDGQGKDGREEGGDSFYIKNAIASVPGASYELHFGDELGGGVPTKALERPDLSKYPTIFMLNVRDLSDLQLKNLETFVKEGGGVAFFMGPLVSKNFYTNKLYNEGKGLFPVPIKDYYPASNQEPLVPEYTGSPQLLLRDDLFPNEASYPIFGAAFSVPVARSALTDLPIKRYFKVPRTGGWKDSKRTMELATLPNELPIKVFQAVALDIVHSKLEKILENEEYAKYQKGLDRHRRNIEKLVGPTSDKKAHHLAQALGDMLEDVGKEKERAEYPNLTEFWANSDPKIRTLKSDITQLHDQVRYGDPFVVGGQFGAGKVVAVMTTAGRSWNDWGGGSRATTVYQPFIWEMQNYLSSQSGESNLTVGTPIEIQVDAESYKQGDGRLKLSRTYYKAVSGKPGEEIQESEQFGQTNSEGVMTFSFPKNIEPGLYVSKLIEEGSGKNLAWWGHVFNVDTVRESRLNRVSYDDLKASLVEKSNGRIKFQGPSIASETLVPRRTDLSESWWLYVLFLVVLVTEQALAVHLSFHMKGNEGETLSRVTNPGAPQVAA